LLIASVALTLRVKAVDKLYDYLVDDKCSPRLGDCVEVPFGPRVLEGYVIALRQDAAPATPDKVVLRHIRRVMDGAESPLPAEWVDLIRFLRTRYLCSWGAAVQTVMPAVKRMRETRTLSLGMLTPGHLLSDEVISYLQKRGAVAQTSLVRRFQLKEHTVQKWLAQGWLLIEREIEPRLRPLSHQILTLVQPEVAGEQVEVLARMGAKQRAVCAYLGKCGGRAPWRDVATSTGATQAVMRSLSERGIVRVSVETVAGQSALLSDGSESPHQLTDEQEQVVATLTAALRSPGAAPFLLHGVTGSGKTEIYLRVIAEVLSQQKMAIVLLPEIALTAQMTARFRRRLGDRIAVLHSGLTDREKYDQWLRIRRGEAQVVLGARSAVFAPVPRLGLIVMDEEHETTYKQENDPRYVTREIADWRVEHTGAMAIFGSATPSLEAMYRVEVGRYRLLTLSKRVGGQGLPQVDVVDMRQQLAGGRQSLFSRELTDALTERLRRGEQSILFLNRRGFATILLCRDCGEAATCPSCDISLTLHKVDGSTARLRCHFCGYGVPLQAVCGSCGSDRIRPFGAGTQRVESELLERFAGVRVIRMDVDTTTARGAHERLLAEFERGEADVLLGTQMIAKGLDFSRVTLVGVIAADTALRVPDFRAAERTFQLLVQVAGRAGRHDLPGQVIVQTFAPDHYAVTAAKHQDYNQFYRTELAARRVMGYPPFTEICKFLISHQLEAVARDHAERLYEDLARRFAADDESVRLLPAVPATIARLRDQFRYQIIVVYKSFQAQRETLTQAYNQACAKAKQDVWVHIDVNAFSLL